jgi:acetylornithine deacetylase/succinyl-diaminopimelate desuccinylase-like protein
MKVIKLAKQLISKPSYLSSKTNEKEIGDFVFSYLKKFPYLKVKKQRIEKGRFNIIAETTGVPRLFLAGHLDTVEPKQGWSKNQFKGIIEKQRLYGLGSLDTKSGVAAILDSLSNFKKISNLTLLFYCDEEYDFKGMKQFTKKYQKKIGDLAVLVEPTNLKIWNACRGLIEICFSVQGKSGYAANPNSGKNAINGIVNVLDGLRKQLQKFKDPIFGSPSLNIAYIRGGLYQGGGGEEIILGKEGNNIADFAEAVIDIRPTKKELCAEIIISLIEKFLKKEGCKLLNFSIRHNFGPFYTKPAEFKILKEVLRKVVGKTEYLDPSKIGYGDGQLLREKFNVPVVYLGPKGANAHGIDEWIDINSLKKLRQIFSELIVSYCKTEHHYNLPL